MNASGGTKRKLKVNIVPMCEEHLDAVMDIEQRVFGTPWRRDDFSILLENPEAVNLVAMSGDRLVGYSCAWCVIESAELGNIAVDSDCQRLGIGRRLLTTTIRTCRNMHVSSLFLEVRLSNERAISLYEYYNFRRIGVRRKYYTNPSEDALIMKLEL
jgi:ribosomal-protein-alanine N-acetyltransferase